MPSRATRYLIPAFMVLLIAILACNAPGNTPAAATVEPSAVVAVTSGDEATAAATGLPAPTATTTISHTTLPSDTPPAGAPIYDVESSGTAAEKRAPYGDSYDINRLERPFLQDMTYIPDLDIVSYAVSQDDSFWYVSIELIGTDPNNTVGIQYAVELDTNHDGFGDYIVLARPPYSSEWDTGPVQIFKDNDHDTGGKTGDHSDAPMTGNGYEQQVFNGGNGGDDPDMGWVRINAGPQAAVQFALKKSWTGAVFMLGVLADAGPKDVGKLDYVDRFTEAEAGSPVRDKSSYPLQALYAVDNTCREAFGFAASGDEPQLCPRDQNNGGGGNGATGCQPPGGKCPSGYYWWPDPHCACSITPYNP